MDLLTTGLRGQKALVTGAASGIGKATSLMLAQAGVQLAMLDVNTSALQESAAECEAFGPSALSLAVDLVDLEAAERAFGCAVAKLGGIDILVNSAGYVGASSKLLEAQIEDLRRVQTINVEAPIVLMKAFAEHAIARGRGGRIINVGSSSAFHVSGKLGYSFTKAALITASRFAARELGPHEITVNAVAPGVTRTPFFGGNPDAATKSGPLANYLGRAAEPEDVAAVILFLCTPAARQMTGQTLHTSAGSV